MNQLNFHIFVFYHNSTTHLVDRVSVVDVYRSVGEAELVRRGVGHARWGPVRSSATCPQIAYS